MCLAVYVRQDRVTSFFYSLVGVSVRFLLSYVRTVSRHDQRVKDSIISGLSGPVGCLVVYLGDVSTVMSLLHPPRTSSGTVLPSFVFDTVKVLDDEDDSCGPEGEVSFSSFLRHYGRSGEVRSPLCNMWILPTWSGLRPHRAFRRSNPVLP